MAFLLPPTASQLREEMESSLSTAYDNFSSSDPERRRKGLRQCEVFFSRVSAPLPASRSPQKNTSPANTSIIDRHIEANLADLTERNVRYRAFFKLQDNFEYNTTLRLLTLLDTLLSTPLTPPSTANSNPPASAPTSSTTALQTTLTLLQGALLLHPPSRALFSQDRHMNTLLDLFDDPIPPPIQSSALLVLVASMLDTPKNLRTFERLDGLWQVCHLFKGRGTGRAVKRGVVEFLYFYLMPEGGTVREGRKGAGERRTQREKQELLRVHLGSVDALVEDLQQGGSAPFS